MSSKAHMLTRRAIRAACNNDDVSSMKQIVNAANEPDAVTTVQEILDIGLDRSAEAHAIEVMSYVLEAGADIHGSCLTSHWGTHSLPSRAMLEILISHGWDINSTRYTSYSKPILWSVLGHPELVEWCLSHGAKVDLDETTEAQHEQQVNIGLRPILERAVYDDIATFELLRERGAKLSPRLLPLAVRAANDDVGTYAGDDQDPGVKDRRRASYKKHLEMIRHLIDVVRIDVNILACWPNSTCSTPLACIACMPRGDATELIWLLLDRGGGIYLEGPFGDSFKIPSAFEAATDRQNKPFLRALEEWEERRDGSKS